jgi:hypothetical protein
MASNRIIDRTQDINLECICLGPGTDLGVQPSHCLRAVRTAKPSKVRGARAYVARCTLYKGKESL